LPSQIHEALTVAGRSGEINEIHLKHWDLSLSSREDRERKVRYYESLNPVSTCEMYYLYEDHEYDAVDESAASNDKVESISAILPGKMKTGLSYAVEGLIRK